MDWYALGVLIFEMLSGLPPFHEPDAGHVVLYEKITQGPACIRWPPFNTLATDLILKFMEHDPTKRYGNLRHGAGDVFAHPWFREVDWGKLKNREITAPYLPRISGAGDASACVYASRLISFATQPLIVLTFINSFEAYPEDNVAAAYGQQAEDPHGKEFPEFEYSSM